MKGDNLMSNIDEIILINQNQGKKIKYLEQEKKNCQRYIKDLKQSLILNKQSLNQLALSNNQQAIAKLNEQNGLLHNTIKRYYEQSLAFPSQLLIQQQLRNEQKKFYNERITEYENTMSQLRKYLQDKQDSFSAIIMRLRKYEELNEVLLLSKVQRFKKDLKEDIIPNVIKQLTEQRDRYKQIHDKFKMNFCDIEVLKKCLENSKSYLQLREAYIKRRNELETDPQMLPKINQNFLSYAEKSKNTTNSSSIQNVSSAKIKVSPNKQLIRLLKKQKMNNEILEEALNDAIEKNEELIEQNNILIESNMQYELRIQNMQCKIVLLQSQLSQFEKSLVWKNKWRNKCDLQRVKPHLGQRLQCRGDETQIHLDSLKSDVDKLSEFIITCVPGPRLQKSLSSHNIDNSQHRADHEIMEEDDIEIEEVV